MKDDKDTGFVEDDKDTGFVKDDKDTGFVEDDEDTGFVEDDKDTGFVEDDKDTGFVKDDKDTGVFIGSVLRITKHGSRRVNYILPVTLGTDHDIGIRINVLETTDNIFYSRTDIVITLQYTMLCFLLKLPKMRTISTP